MHWSYGRSKDASVPVRALKTQSNVAGGRSLKNVCRQNISDIRFGNLREYLAHLV